LRGTVNEQDEAVTVAAELRHEKADEVRRGIATSHADLWKRVTVYIHISTKHRWKEILHV